MRIRTLLASLDEGDQAGADVHDDHDNDDHDDDDNQ